MILIAFFLAALAFLFLPRQNDSKLLSLMSTPTLKLTLAIAETKIMVELADSTEAMRLGLGERDSLPENEGMLFDYGTKRPAVFWMKGMRFPLDIIWIADGVVVQIDEKIPHEPGVAEQNLKMYPSNQEVDSVLEVNAGFTKKNNIKVGDLITIAN
ncbi:hypothetical protein A2897_02520 [Candidatus Woesebacteria bacterium RIFCSPLOWO2_01_FULL_44_24b]|nr:MAG: hypothetical protein A2897_02520 [Candidatus Woesebacteria bacterium RIFCSPLOWO2_01_FULL_44_24b]